MLPEAKAKLRVKANKNRPCRIRLLIPMRIIPLERDHHYAEYKRLMMQQNATREGKSTCLLCRNTVTLTVDYAATSPHEALIQAEHFLYMLGSIMEELHCKHRIYYPTISYAPKLKKYKQWLDEQIHHLNAEQESLATLWKSDKKYLGIF